MSSMSHDWILNWFAERNPDKISTISLNVEYYKDGLVDSFGIIELISDIENHFLIQFLDEDFRSKDFKTIGGLIGLTDGKLA